MQGTKGGGCIMEAAACSMDAQLTTYRYSVVTQDYTSDFTAPDNGYARSSAVGLRWRVDMACGWATASWRCPRWPEQMEVPTLVSVCSGGSEGQMDGGVVESVAGLEADICLGVWGQAKGRGLVMEVVGGGEGRW